MMKPLIRIMMQSDTTKDEWYTLEVFSSGNITCNCESQMYNKDRDIKSNCKHVKRLKEISQIWKTEKNILENT